VVAHIAAKEAGVSMGALEQDFGWASSTIARAVSDARSQSRLQLDDAGNISATAGPSRSQN
jgi:hypothetical protein